MRIRTLLPFGLPVGLAAAAVLAVPTTAGAATAPKLAVADSYGIDVDARALAGAVPVQASVSRASQLCPPTPKSPVVDTVLDLGPVPNPSGELIHNADTLKSTASASCTEPRSVATAEVQNLELLASNGQPQITADAILASSTSSCTAEPTAEGTKFVNLTIGGQPIPIDPDPNTVIPLGLITVIVNEQQVADGGRGLVVNALHVIGNIELLQGDIIVSHARSGVACGGAMASGTGTSGSGTAAGEGNEDFTLGLVAIPTTVRPGGVVTYTATIQNKGESDCLVNRFIAHLPAPFGLVSTSGALGKDAVAEARSDSGVDAVMRPDAITIAAGKLVTQTFVVSVPASAADGDYASSLELFCADLGNFVAGPFGVVNVSSAKVLGVKTTAAAPADPAPTSLPRTGTSVAILTAMGLLALVAGSTLHRQAAEVRSE